MSDLNATREAAASKVSKAGGFPEQEQQPPGSTTAMNPVPDHGEDTWVGRDRLVGLKALITGGDSGIGRAVAIAFAREGCDVALSYLSEEQEVPPRCLALRTVGLDGNPATGAGQACEVVRDTCARVADGAACEAWRRYAREAESRWRFAHPDNAERRKTEYERMARIVGESCGE